MKLITISGLDGSGKSTQLNLLKEKLEKENKKTLYFHAVQFSLASRLTGKSKSEPGKHKAVTRSGKLGICLRKIFLLIDLIRFRSFYSKINRENACDYLISDRYFFDQIANIIYLENGNDLCSVPWLKSAMKYLVKPDLAFLLRLPSEIILQRERQIEQGKEYLDKKDEIFQNIAPIFNLIQVDGKTSREEISNFILEKIKKL